MTTRRILVVGLLGVAVLSLGGIAVIYAVTDAPPAPALSTPPALEARAPPPAVGTPSAPVAATPPAAPPRVERAKPAAPARAPRAAPAPHQAGDSPGATTGTPVVRGADRMKVSFKMDSRLTRGLHMGARWVSPPTYVGTHDGSLFTVQARARGAGAAGAIRDPTWLPAEPDMVAVTPDRGSEVEIAVLREGRSTLTVAEDGVSKTLMVNAVHRDGVWRVEIAQ
jgi:hypothetical protein